MDRIQLRQLLTAAVDAGIEALADGLAQALPSGGPVRMVPIADLAVRPEVYQFRLSCISRSGTDDRLKHCSRFRRELAGVVLAWREPEGQLALLDGHHRYELARRSGVTELAVLEVEAADARAARVVGAMANLAAGNASAPDLARLLRDEGMTAGDLSAYGVSRRSRLAADAVALVPLAEELFVKVCTGQMDTDVGVALAGAGPDAVQRDLWAEAERRHWGADQIAEAAKLAQLATVRTTTPDGCLPGFEALLQSDGSDLGALLAVRAAIRRQLGAELQALATVARKRAAVALEAAGVAVVDRALAADARDSGRAVVRVFDQLVGMAGPLQQTIRAMADEVSAGRSAAEVVTRRLPDVRAAIERELGS